MYFLKVNFKIFTQFFLSGLILGSSLCLLSCPFILFPLITQQSKTWKEGVKIGLIFGSGRIIAYGFLGGLASFSHFLLQDFLDSKMALVFGGSILIGIGVWFLFYGDKCRKNHIISKLPAFFTGVTYGFIPCAPLTGFLFTYLVYMSKGIIFGVFSGIVFGLGTLFSPILALCGIFPHIGEKINKFQKGKIYLKIIGTLLFFFWGTSLILTGLR